MISPRYLSACLAAAAMLAATPSAVLADGPGSGAWIDERMGFTYLDANYRAPVDCWKAAIRKGAPAGAQTGGDIPVTVMMTEAGPCRPGPKIARAVGMIGVYPMGEIVRIFFVDPRGRIVKTERVSIDSPR